MASISKAFLSAVNEGSVVWTDGAPSYNFLNPDPNLEHETVHRKGEFAKFRTASRSPQTLWRDFSPGLDARLRSRTITNASKRLSAGLGFENPSSTPPNPQKKKCTFGVRPEGASASFALAEVAPERRRTMAFSWASSSSEANASKRAGDRQSSSRCSGYCGCRTSQSLPQHPLIGGGRLQHDFPLALFQVSANKARAMVATSRPYDIAREESLEEGLARMMEECVESRVLT